MSININQLNTQESSMKFALKTVAMAILLAGSALSHASVTLVQTSDPGYYNNSIGTVLNGTNGGETGPFPIFDDSPRTFPTAPDLSAAQAALGNWLSAPTALNANWSLRPSIPSFWTPGEEVAIIYRFDTLGATNVVARIGVDNGVFAWLDGNYLFGARGPGGVNPGEYVIPLGNLAAGTYFLQLLLEDHGGFNGYDVLITADTFIPGVPEPASLFLLAAGIAAVGLRTRKQAVGSHPG